MATSEKLKEIQDAGTAIWGSGALAAIKLPEERLQNVFAVAHDAGTMRKQTDLVQQVMGGLIDPRQLSMRLSGVEALKFSQEMQSIKEKQARDTRMLLAMLDDMDRIAERIEAANARIESGLAELKEKYGDDYVQVVAGSILTDEEIAGCKTDDELLVLMAEKAFDESGNLKPGFEHLDPTMIEVLREVHDREEFKLEGAAIVREYQENGGELTPELEEKTADFGAVASIQARSSVDSEGNEELAKTANTARANQYASSITGGGLDLGDLT